MKFNDIKTIKSSNDMSGKRYKKHEKRLKVILDKYFEGIKEVKLFVYGKDTLNILLIFNEEYKILNLLGDYNDVNLNSILIQFLNHQNDYLYRRFNIYKMFKYYNWLGRTRVSLSGCLILDV